MIIFGWGKQTVKHYGESEKSNCTHCHNREGHLLRRYRTWFTLFFIPVIPYGTSYVRQCPICSYGEVLSKEDFLNLVGDPATLAQSKAATRIQASHEDGLTETQRNYRREMAEHKAKIANQDRECE